MGRGCAEGGGRGPASPVKAKSGQGSLSTIPQNGVQGMTPFLLCHRLFRIGLLLLSASSSRPPHPVIYPQSVSPTVPRTVMVVTDSNGTEWHVQSDKNCPFLPMSQIVLHLYKSLHSSVQFSRSIVSDSLRPHELQHARPPCPSPTPGFAYFLLIPLSAFSIYHCHQPSPSHLPELMQFLPISPLFPLQSILHTTRRHIFLYCKSD